MSANASDVREESIATSERGDEPALALLRALAEDDGQSLPRLAKRLGLAASELQRLCVALGEVVGEDARFGGLGLIEARPDARGRARLWLSPRGRRLVQGAALDWPANAHDTPAPAAAASIPASYMPAPSALAGAGATDAAGCDGVHPVRTLRIGGASRLHSPPAAGTDASGKADLPTEEWAHDWAIDETPVALLYNGRSFAVMMATAADLDDFALGFALCERIVESAAEFRLVDTVRRPEGIAVHAAIPQARFDALEARQRGLEGRSGCGLCGISELEAALRPAKPVGTGPQVRVRDLRHALERLTESQTMNARSGGAHAAAFVAGDYRLVREDVGRHNAVDKAVGALHRDPDAPAAESGCLIVTSRASSEIVHKAANAGICIVVAMSAPTALAVRHAQAAGITLVAFARAGRMNVYTAPQRLR
jgi:formate dehydrogenase accessory protein FdhD